MEVTLLSAAACGDELGVRRALEADPEALNEVGSDGTTPLCAAALWGHIGILRILLDAGADPGLKNSGGPRWTALHAATLQEQGKACMLLLDYKADPHDRDIEGVTPCDYASCSEPVWPLFAARGCQRTAKSELAEKGVLRKVSAALEGQLQGEAESGSAQRRGLVAEYSRPGSSYVVSREFPARPGSVAGVRGSPLRPGTTSRKSSPPIDILAEEDDNSAVSTAGHSKAAAASPGIRSLAF